MKKRVNFKRQSMPQTTIQGTRALTKVNLTQTQVAIVCLVFGAVFGLVVLGWWLWPVEWTDAKFEHLGPNEQALLVELAADLHAYDPDSPRVIELSSQYGEIDALACFVASQELEQSKRIQLMALAYKINERGCQ